jgi:hypothetical protein
MLSKELVVADRSAKPGPVFVLESTLDAGDPPNDRRYFNDFFARRRRSKDRRK